MAKQRNPLAAPARRGGRYWIAVIPKSRVESPCGNFAMFAHGRHTAVKRTRPGDWLAYYSPRTKLERRRGSARLHGHRPIQPSANPMKWRCGRARVGWRRDIAFEKAHEADVYPLLDQLSFITDRQHWGIPFHRSLFSVSRDDFALDRRGHGA